MMMEIKNTWVLHMAFTFDLLLKVVEISTGIINQFGCSSSEHYRDSP
jgi:hypothetical protein